MRQEWYPLNKIQKFIEASSLNKSDFKVYSVKDYFNMPSVSTRKAEN